MTAPDKKKSAIAGVLKNIPFFAGLSAQETLEVERLILKRHFSRGQVVLFEEDTTKYMYIIFSGKVRVVQVSDEGKERMLAIHKRNEFFGEMALFDGKTAPATVIAMEDTEIGLLSKENFEKFLLNNDKILHQFLTMLCMRLRESWLMIKIMSFADAEQRVRAVLKDMIRLYGVKDQRGVLVDLKLTHKDIANFASVSRETVSRLLSRLIKDGEIEVLDRKYIVIKTPFLEKQANL